MRNLSPLRFLASSRLLASALAVTVVASLSLSVTSAGPAAGRGTSDRTSVGSHAAARPAVLNVHITVKKHLITRSKTGFRPGNTLFHLTSSNGGRAAVQLARFRAGYSFRQFRKDANSFDIEAIRRIDRKVVFYGGMPVSQRQSSHIGMRLKAGRYFIFDFDGSRWTTLRVEGARQRRPLPQADGSVDMVMRRGEHRFRTPRHLPHAGWMEQTNLTDEPHFMDMIHVRRSTTREQVRRAFAGQGPEDPGWLLREYPGTFVVSPGHTVVWRYSYPRGKYLEVCFWPSDENGMPHAQMGMWDFVTLH